MNGEQYRKLREAAGYTQPALAEKLGVSVDTIGRRESGTAIINGEAEIAITNIAQGTVKLVPTDSESERLPVKTVSLVPGRIDRSNRKPLWGAMLRDPSGK